MNLYIIKNLEKYPETYNLMDEKGNLILTKWATEIKRIIIPEKESGSDNGPQNKKVFYKIYRYSPYSSRLNTTHLLDENANNVFADDMIYIELFDKKSNPPSFIVKTAEDEGKLYRVIDLHGKYLTEGCEKIELRNLMHGTFVRIEQRICEKTIESFLSYPDYKPITNEWFDNIVLAPNNYWERAKPFFENKNYVCLVKHNGRIKALMKDGSLIAAPGK